MDQRSNPVDQRSNPVDQMRTVVLYGTSLSIAAIGAGLADRPGWQVIPLDATSPTATRHLRRLRPDVILFDLAAAQPEAAIPLLKELPTLLLIGVDLANHQALVLSGEQPRLFTADDFVNLIEAQSFSGPEGGQHHGSHSMQNLQT